MVPWLVIAKSYIGTKEIVGKEHNPTILGWLKRFALNIGKWGRGQDETPWCAVFVSNCLESAGYPSTRNALAASYVTYGKHSLFKEGAIVVIRKRQPAGSDANTGSATGHHVFFATKLGKYWVEGVGGNQHNSVSVAKFKLSKYMIVATRWPSPLD
jgi:uncharacterized protein (TIGR02594 family)